MVLSIASPVLERSDGKARLSARVRYDQNDWNLFYEVDDTYGGFLSAARADAFLLPVLPFAMMASRTDRDITISCEAPLSRRLYHQLTQYYLPVLCKNISYYRPVRIEAETTDEALPCAGRVGTGISGGVDSSYTIAKYMDAPEGCYRLTHGIFFNVGIYGGYDSPSEVLLEAKARKIAADTGIEFLHVRSNTLKEVYGKAHAPVVPAIFMGGALSLQKLFSVYYYSSGFSAAESHFADEDAAYYDWLNTQSFSTENTVFYSSGIEATRLEKVRFIADYPFTWDNLSVCLTEDQHSGNCGRCAKCTRTMAELETIGALDRYAREFDVAAFRADPAYHWGYVLLKAWGGDSFCGDIVRAYKESGRRLPARAYVGAIRKWIRRGGTTKNRAREKVENRN